MSTRDGSVGGQSGRQRTSAGFLRLVYERITAKELICRRVSDEVDRVNRAVSRAPTDGERTRSHTIRFDPDSPELALNPHPRRRDGLDEVPEMVAALKAFADGRFIMLVDGREVENLYEPIGLTPDSEVVFLRLTPLAGA